MERGRWLRPLWYLGNNPISQVGIMLATASAVTVLTFFSTSFFGVELTPYAGIVAFLVLPAVFVSGLALIPLGMLLRRRREVAAGRLPSVYPPIDLRQTATRETLLFVLVMTGFNVAIFLAATYRGVHLMESTAFCGETCHTVMEPEHVAYQQAAHARVPCVDCHIGPGAPWFVRSKLSGTYQVIAVTFDLFPRPIPTPIHNLRPSRDTCEQCHWPEKFVGDRLVVRSKFTDEEKPVEQKTVLLMRTGGLDPLSGKPLGNHGVHLQPGSEIHYVPTDPKRQEITWVRYRKPDGEVVVYRASAEAPEPAEDEWRLMDCIDCHNRPAHWYEMPERAVDRAMASGLLDRTLPWVRNRALELLQGEYPTFAEASKGIRAGFRQFYAERYADVAERQRTTIDAAGDVLVQIYGRNVFPEMKVTWGTYPNNLGHDPFPGCLRCHDGSHESADGRKINDDCTVCHGLVAVEEEDPAVLEQLLGGATAEAGGDADGQGATPEAAEGG